MISRAPYIESDVMTSAFSDRYGLRGSNPRITVRGSAPQDLREVAVRLANRYGLDYQQIGNILLDTLGPSVSLMRWYDNCTINNSWTLTPLFECEWWLVYDMIEKLYSELICDMDLDEEEAFEFEVAINEYMVSNGIGWELSEGEIVTRGPDDFRSVVRDAVDNSENASLPVIANEISMALKSLSQRPEHDLTGAISHSVNALEAIANDIAGTGQKTLGSIVDSLDLPAPLDQAVCKLYGFASQYGRHVSEGRPASFEEAQLTVHIASALVTYLLSKAENAT